MSDTANIEEFLERVQEMLDALSSHSQSSSDFKAACENFEVYLNEQTDIFANAKSLSENDIKRIKSIINRLARLQNGAEKKAAIPKELQKYIAEQLD